MECKFIRHGIALSYDNIVKPCCVWTLDETWKQDNHLASTDFTTWHRNPKVIEIQKKLSSNEWPAPCINCQKSESRGRGDSMRGNGHSAYSHYQDNDITLEIRPGNTCNFSCQTCWPAASSKVAQHHHQAGLIDIRSVDSRRIDNFDFLLPIKHRIRDVVLLGGEPFYDKSCKRFLSWAQEHLDANMIMFTNGSLIDWDFVSNYRGKLTLVFSIDAVGSAAEYIRPGTIWSDILTNYQRAKNLVSVRVNITCSVYNYHHLESLMQMLAPNWPDVVTFGTPNAAHLLEGVIPVKLREDIINSLSRAVDLVESATIESGQKSNTINALKDIIARLETLPWDQNSHQKWCNFVSAMDRVKGLHASNYCSVLENILQYKVSQVG